MGCTGKSSHEDFYEGICDVRLSFNVKNDDDDDG